MVCVNSLFRTDNSISDEAQHFNKSQLVFSIIDFSSKKRYSSSIFLGIVNELEGIISGPCAPAQNAYNEVGVVLYKLFHETGAVINYLEKYRSGCLGNSCQSSNDIIVNKSAKLISWNTGVYIRIKNFQKISKSFSLCLFSKLFKLQ